MNHEENDQLWTLLGKARKPEVSPFFASKVVRAVRAAAESRPGILEWLRRNWQLPIATGAAAAILAILALRPISEPASSGFGADPLEEIAVAAAATPEVIPSLDALLASEDHSIWLAGDPSSLY